jgi:serine protease Do
VDGEVIKDSRELVQKLDGIAPGTSVTLTVFRNGAPTTLNLTVGTPPSELQAQTETKATSETPANREPGLGVVLAPVASLAGGSQQGVAVVAVDPGGAGAEHGLQAGDVILNVSGQAVSNPEDVNNRVAQLRTEGKRTVLMEVKSGDSTKFVALPLGKS